VTVASDLQLRAGVERRLALRIDGLNYDFWQEHDIAAPAAGVNGWRTPLECLEIDGEVGGELDVREMRAEMSGLEVKLRNCYDSAGAYTHRTNDPQTAYLLAQEFAPGRWSTGAETHLRKSASESYVRPSSGTQALTCNDNSDFASSGTAYIGPIAFTYTGKAGPSGGKYTFTGCTLGVYPCIGTSAYVGRSIRIDPDEEAGHVAGLSITEYPRTMLGRRVALYVVTLDSDGTWPAFSSAELLWTGHIDIAVGYDSSEGVWRLSCKSLLASLENDTIGGDMVQGGLIGINLGGPMGLSMSGSVDADSPISGDRTRAGTFAGTFPSGYYATHIDLARALQNFFDDVANWTSAFPRFVMGYRDGRYQITASDQSLVNWQIKLGATSTDATGWVHPLQALGFPQRIELTSDNYKLVAEHAPFESYHPLAYQCNGGNMYTSISTTPFVDQGDAGSRSYFLLSRTYDDAAVTGVGRGDGSRVVSVTGSSYSAPRRTFNLSVAQPWDTGIRAHAGTRLGGDRCEVRQCWFQEERQSGKGVFETLLYGLLSTGAQNGVYNGAYDEAPPQLGVGIQASLVDTDSFVSADAIIGTSPFGERPYSLIAQSEQPWIELLQREAKLFGFFLAWSRGKLALVRGLAPSVNQYIVTLGDSTNAQVVERPQIELLADQVVNAWQAKVRYNASEDDYDGSSITLNDRDSQEALRQTGSVEIEHPGLVPPWEDSAGFVAAGLQQLFDGDNQTRWALRTPPQRVELSLGPAYALRVYAGDVVRYQCDNHPDPYGSGSMSVDALALVSSVQWDWHTWTASATLLIYADSDALDLTPWAPAATCDRDNIDEGSAWVDAGDYLKLEPYDFGDSASDNEDGEAFLNDHEILIIWTHPTDPASGETLGPFTVDHYDNTNQRLYLSGSPSISLTAGREYAVVYADWGSASSSQKLLGLWQASGTTHKLSSDGAQRYG
jgi:hypothetical protein